MKILYLIPARGGSKGIPYKNIKLLNGKPLIYYTIDAARGVAKDEDICVSTDDELIIKCVEDYGLKVPFIRPSEYATDCASSEDVIKHAIKWYKEHGIDYDIVVLLQPTSPLRTTKNIQDAIDLYDDELDMIVSLKESHASANICQETSDGYIKLSLCKGDERRQDMQSFHEYNGAVFVINTSALFNKRMINFDKIKGFCMSEEESWDIDTVLDWKIVEMLLREKRK